MSFVPGSSTPKSSKSTPSLAFLLLWGHSKRPFFATSASSSTAQLWLFSLHPESSGKALLVTAGSSPLCHLPVGASPRVPPQSLAPTPRKPNLAYDVSILVDPGRKGRQSCGPVYLRGIKISQLYICHRIILRATMPPACLHPRALFPFHSLAANQ